MRESCAVSYHEGTREWWNKADTLVLGISALIRRAGSSPASRTGQAADFLRQYVSVVAWQFGHR